MDIARLSTAIQAAFAPIEDLEGVYGTRHLERLSIYVRWKRGIQGTRPDAVCREAFEYVSDLAVKQNLIDVRRESLVYEGFVHIVPGQAFRFLPRAAQASSTPRA